MIERYLPTFELVSKYQPAGDQPEAINQLVDGVVGGKSTNLIRCDWNRENIYDFQSY